MQDNVEQGTVDLQTAFDTAGVMDEAEFPEAVHEKTYARTGRADHLCQTLLTDLGNHGLGHSLLAKMREQ